MSSYGIGALTAAGAEVDSTPGREDLLAQMPGFGPLPSDVYSASSHADQSALELLSSVGQARAARTSKVGAVVAAAAVVAAVAWFFGRKKRR